MIYWRKSEVSEGLRKAGDEKAHRRLRIQSNQADTKLDESTHRYLHSSDALHSRRAEEESQSLRQRLDANEGRDGRVVAEGRKGEGSKGVVGERVYIRRGER